jgi:hypothetical protein
MIRSKACARDSKMLGRSTCPAAALLGAWITLNHAPTHAHAYTPCQSKVGFGIQHDVCHCAAAPDGVQPIFLLEDERIEQSDERVPNMQRV